MLNKTDIKEKAIFLSITFCVFLPIRFFFYTFVSTWWVGSFGLISAVMIIMLILVKYEKLGYLGRIWKKQIVKISKGKLGKLVMAQSILFILFFSGVVYLTDINRDTQQTNTYKGILEDQGIDSVSDIPVETVIKSYTLENIILVARAVAANPEIIGQVYAIIDYMSMGFHQHINIVWLVEEIETLSFIIYFRYFYKVEKQYNHIERYYKEKYFGKKRINLV